MQIAASFPFNKNQLIYIIELTLIDKYQNWIFNKCWVENYSIYNNFKKILAKICEIEYAKIYTKFNIDTI